MGDHSALLTMIMIIKTVRVVQQIMVEGGGSVPATTVSLLVATVQGTSTKTFIGVMGVMHLTTFHMWR